MVLAIAPTEFERYQHAVAEWVLMPQPQGLVCLRVDGGALWLQLESEASSRELAKGLAAEDWPPEAIDSVLRGHTIIDLDFSAQLERPARSPPAIELQAQPRLMSRYSPRLPES